jgi:hypothetical protein
MRKYATFLHETPTARKRSRLPLWLGLGLLLLCAPLLYEWGLVIYAQWASMTGSYWEPHTPILDTLKEWSRLANQDVRYSFSRVLNSGPWKAQLAVPLAIGWAFAMAVVFLRRTR